MSDINGTMMLHKGNKKKRRRKQMFNDTAFCDYCRHRGFKLCAVARAMGMEASTLYRKRKGNLEFTINEIQKFFHFSGETIENPEMVRIFFASSVA